MRYIALVLFIFAFSSSLLAQKKSIPYDKYSELTSKERISNYRDGCFKDKSASHCLQLSQSVGSNSFLHKAAKFASCDYGFKEVCKELDEEDFMEACTFKDFGYSKAACSQKFSEIDFNTGSTILFYGSLFGIFLATFIVAFFIFQEDAEFKASETVGDSSKEQVNLAEYGIVLKYSKPLFKRYLSPVVAGMKNKKQIRDKYKRLLAQGGVTNFLTTEDFYAFKLFLIIGFPMAFLGLREFMEMDWPLEVIPLVSIFGYYYPEIWIKGRIQMRQEEILMNMPFAVDMLALSSEAGIDFIEAMEKVVLKAKPSALTEEFDTVLQDIKVGSSKSEALRALIWRNDLIQLASFCATLIAAMSVGAEIPPILKALSGEMRQKKSALIEKQGATAQGKILIPLIFLIVPAVFLMIAAPMGIQFVQGGGGP